MSNSDKFRRGQDTLGDATGSGSQLSRETGGQFSGPSDRARDGIDGITATTRRAGSSSGAEGNLGGGENTNVVALRFECDELSIDWVVEHGSLEEELGQPYRAELSVSTPEFGEPPTELLGQSCRLTIERAQVMRRIHGIVAEVHEDHTEGQRMITSLLLVPAFALTAQTIDTRIYQNKTVPEILEDVLERALPPYRRSYDLRLHRDYPTCEYRTQFNETGLGFCQRLMEEEGIFFWFEQEEDSELLVITDTQRNCAEVESANGSLIEFTEYEGTVAGHEYISSFLVSSQLCPTKVTTRHQDWTHSRALIEGNSEPMEPDDDRFDEGIIHGARVSPDREHYEQDWQALTLHRYHDRAYQADDLDNQLRLRREQQSVDARLIRGKSSVVDMTPGKTFELVGHPRGELCVRYIVVSSLHHFGNQSLENSFRCIPHEAIYRPHRLTPKPRIPGIETATVVGPHSEEIHTDEHGRVKVQFHWDRQGEENDNSSCWVRVMQAWAGTGWGFVFIPRIGMEVVVTFINGDPDKPMVTGSLYNDHNTTPYDLPREKTKSTIKSQSSLGGVGFNEFRFEDATGREEIFTHAQKDYNEVVLNNHTTTVNNCQRNVVAINHDNHIGQQHTESVGANQILTVQGNRIVAIEGNQQVTVRGGESIHSVEDAYQLDATKTITETAPEKITIQCEGSSITLEPNKITIQAGGGAKIVLDADALMQSDAGSQVKLDDAALTASSEDASSLLTADVEHQASGRATLRLTSDGEMVSSGGGIVKVTGPLVELNC